MVSAPPNHNSLKDSSLQQINNGDNRRLTHLATIAHNKTGKKSVCVWGGGGGGGRGGLSPNLTLL